MIKTPLKSYFGKDWKFFWRYDTTIGAWYGAILSIIGLFLLNTGRKFLKKGGGKIGKKYYQYCSWCGRGPIQNGGLNHSCGKKGRRCMSTPSCDQLP